MKVKNRLLNFNNMSIYQDDDYFLFSLDSVLLANFVTIKLSDKKIIDLCSGNGPVPMLMSFRTKARIFAVEIQKYIYDMGIASIKENKLDEQIEFINMDVKKLNEVFEPCCFDIVTCNPPYFKYQPDGLINKNIGKAIARHEVMVKLNDIVIQANYLLKNGGTLAIVHRPERLVEIIELLKQYDFEPKKLQFCYPKIGRDANILLIEAVKKGNRGLKILEPLIIHKDDGEYVDKIKEMFGSD